MMGTIGRKNMLFGFGYFLATLALGLFLANQAKSGDPEWMESTAKHLLGTAHAHGNLESLLNIVCGLLLCRFGAAAEGLAKAASVLLIVAALMHSGILLISGAGLGAALNLAPVGAFSLVAAMALMMAVVAKGLPAAE